MGKKPTEMEIKQNFFPIPMKFDLQTPSQNIHPFIFNSRNLGSTHSLRNALDPTEAVMIRGKGKGEGVLDHYSFS